MWYSSGYFDFSSRHRKATSLPSGENTGSPLAPGELTSGTTLGGGPEYFAGPLEKYHWATTARTTTAAVAAQPHGRDFFCGRVACTASVCAAERPEDVSR